MGLRFSLDTSCVLNLLNPDEKLDDDLIELMRLAMNGDADLFVTDIYHGEAAGNVEGRRAAVAARARLFPVIEVPADRHRERDNLADGFFKTLWPNSPGDTGMADHGRRDCLHLASHVLTGGTAFVTRDTKLLSKVSSRLSYEGLMVYSPRLAVEAIERARPQRPLFVTQSIGVRQGKAADRGLLQELLLPLRTDYSDFEGWLTKTLDDAKTVVNLGVVGAQDVRGVAIWKWKDARTAKLSTFYLHPEARNAGLGQHLLFHCIRQWIEHRIERAYVTASAEKNDIIEFCLSFGFRVEGAAMNRYSGGRTELVLTKHLSFRTIDDDEIVKWLDDAVLPAFSLVPPTEAANPKNWFLAPRSLRRSIRWNVDTASAEFLEDDGAEAFRKTVAELEELFYPVRLGLRGRAAFVVPIQPQWANRMMNTKPFQGTLFNFADKLMLRIDNAYYCTPVYADDDVVGSPILFYVSAPESAVTGMARIINRVIAEPEDLYLRYGQMGIYKLQDIQGHISHGGRHDGCAMAMHFGWWVPFPEPVTLKKLVTSKVLNGHPQRMQKITFEVFERALKLGGVEW